MKLRQIAHSRTGDKGNVSNISLIVYRMEDYPLIAEQVTAERVKEWFKEIVQGQVTRYELPQLGALNFVMDRALDGGVLRSLAVDRHGKSLSSALLEMEIEKHMRMRPTIRCVVELEKGEPNGTSNAFTA